MPHAISVALLVLAGGGAIAIFGAHLGSSRAPGVGTWSAAAQLITGREEHTATLLPDGRVLVAGGLDGRGQPLASAAIYNPATNSWRAAGAMSTPRVDHTATLLSNGQVLIAGGMAVAYLASTELYDPATNRWTASTPMHQARAHHTAILLKDRRVMVVGGVGSTAVDGGGAFLNLLSTGEIYDPRTNRWSVTSPMVHTRLAPTVAMLQDGRVLVAGGQDGTNQDTSAEIYDPNVDRWSPTRPMATACDEATATVLTSGKVLVVGGEGRLADVPLPYGSVPVACVELYDPKTDAWSLAANLSAPRLGHTATLLRNGNVMVIGDSIPGTSRPAEIYDPVANRWSTVSQPMQRYDHTATRLLDGRLLIVGGYGPESLRSAMTYDARGASPQLNPVVVGLWASATLVVLALVTMPLWRPRLAAWFIRQRSEEWLI